MSAEQGLLPALITLILAAGGGLRWWLTRRDSKSPIPTATAEAALVAQLVGLSGDTLDDMRSDIKDQREQLRVQREDREADRLRLDEMNAKLDQMTRLFSVSTTFIEAMLRWADDGSKPPPPTLPALLHQAIDPSLHAILEEKGRL